MRRAVVPGCSRHYRLWSLPENWVELGAPGQLTTRRRVWKRMWEKVCRSFLSPANQSAASSRTLHPPSTARRLVGSPGASVLHAGDPRGLVTRTRFSWKIQSPGCLGRELRTVFLNNLPTKKLGHQSWPGWPQTPSYPLQCCGCPAASLLW